MILNKRKLREWEKSSFISFTKEQEKLILEQFGTEHGNGQEWSEQDIVEQVRKIMRAHPRPVRLSDFL